MAFAKIRNALRTRRLQVTVFAALAGLLSAPVDANAAESGTGFYLLGSKGPFAAVMPGPGAYFQNDVYVYSGSAGASRDLPIGGSIVANIDATAYIDLATGLWVLPQPVLGGNLALQATLPWGGQNVNANLALAGGQLGASTSDTVFTIGDPVVGASLGWHNGNWHWVAGFLVNVPIGDYQEGEIANVAFHRWGLDLNGGVTWFDPQSGWEVSGLAGITFNGENPATNYTTGTEFHFEGAVTKTFSPQFSAGLVGYFYQQVSPDSGPGARLGDFEGRVAALGGTAGYNFQLGTTPVATRIKVYREFAAENRLEGTSAFLTVTIPLGGAK
ncbi:SphA family protein [Roseibium sp. Sym1]|uniref:SphA family protein n=1 Tax=Roseibium sp. Sym1 TaxID=3016006 RepID=UPI0022B5C379|nr:transporter [Roseibium sp. Sym1]